MRIRLLGLGPLLLAGLLIGSVTTACETYGSGNDNTAPRLAATAAPTTEPTSTVPRLAYLTPGAVSPTSAPTTAPTTASSFAQGGSTRINEKRQIALRPWLRDMMDVIRQAGDGGVNISLFARKMREKPGFAQTLKEQKATVAQAVELFPEIRAEKRGNSSTLTLASDAPIPRSGTLDAFAR